MFSLHDFIMKTLKGMFGQYPDFQVMEFALNWYEKGKLTEEDLAEVEAWFEPDPEKVIPEEIYEEGEVE